MSRGNARIHPTIIEEEKQVNSDERDGYVEESLAWFRYESPLRQRLLHICKPGSKFDSFILVMILMNTIIMACVDYRYVNEHYEPVSDHSFRNYLVEKAEIFFMIFFLLECAIKMIAWGFVEGEKAYIRSGWNIFDFVIVLCRYVVCLFPFITETIVLLMLLP